MKKIILSLRSSAKQLASVPAVSVAGMLTALSVSLSLFNLVISDVMQIRFSFLPLSVGAMMYGPVMGAVIGAVSDVLGYLVHPSGPFFPGFTLNTLLTGAIYGFALYQRPITLKRVIAVSLCVVVGINLLLNSVWLSILYGQGFLVLIGSRAIKNLIMFPINTTLLYSVLKVADKIRHRNHVSE